MERGEEREKGRKGWERGRRMGISSKVALVCIGAAVCTRLLCVTLCLTEDADELLIIDDEEDVVMETTDVVSRKRKAIEDVTSSSDFVTAKKRCITNSALNATDDIE